MLNESLVDSGSQILDALHKTNAVLLFSNALNEVIGLLPIVIPVTIGYIAVHKGLGFLFGSLRKA